MMRAIVLLALACASLRAYGAEWVRLPELRGPDQYFYDRTKLVIEGEEITYWKKVAFAQPQPVKGRLAAWALMRERIHCGQHTLRLISYLYYGADGSIIDYVPDHEKEGTPIIPDTLGDAFERHLCAQVKARQATVPMSPGTEASRPPAAPEPMGATP